MPAKTTQVLQWQEIEQIRRLLAMATPQVAMILEEMKAHDQHSIQVSGVTGALKAALKCSAFAHELGEAWSKFDTMPGREADTERAGS